MDGTKSKLDGLLAGMSEAAEALFARTLEDEARAKIAAAFRERGALTSREIGDILAEVYLAADVGAAYPPTVVERDPDDHSRVNFYVPAIKVDAIVRGPADDR